MRIIPLIFFIIFFQNTLHAEALTMQNISKNILQGLHLRIQGENKTIIENIYQETGNKALWIGKSNKKKASDLIQALNDPLFNYKNKSFDQSSISRLFYMLDNGDIPPSKKAAAYARLDLLLTNSMVRLVRFIVQGDVDWKLVQQKINALKESDDIQAVWEMSSKTFPEQKKLISAIVNGNIYDYLNDLIPMKRYYRQLITLLEDYRVMDKFPKIPYSNKVLKLGDSANRIKEIKKRLQISGDYPKNAPIDNKFNQALQKAVKTYQKRYLLKITGTIDKKVTYYLNQPAKKNIQAIITNLDKTKLYPEHFEDEYIEVNIPDFNLRYYRQEEMLYKMGLVVGRIDRPTPIFSDYIEYIVLNPTWTIPDNLIKRDLIHVLRENPMYLKEHNIHVYRGKKEIEITQEMLDPYEKSDKRVPYRFIQFSGDSNALGRVKFMFPNKYAVYLHDTDNKSLLSRRYKIYSSGCMRVEKPFKLLDTLLIHARKSYDETKISQIIESNKPTTIRLKKAIPVHILYFTVYQEDNLAYFKNDIYLYDKIIEESVKGNKKPTFKIPKKRMVSIRKVKTKK
ncbi:Peptidoglycan-binding domain 1 [hydrothermal vent metagenome]|uniref:Peptidoglycan-binding domain 1 n=1 Tax=hydrothermal vent metagenome TaxID=652676 RepID=A0A1W1BVR6_9ZZZZ